MTVGEQLLKAFTYDAANHMTAVLQIKDGVEKRVRYTYDALGNRTGQDIYTAKTGNPVPAINDKVPQDPEQHIRYTLDLTRQYHNLLLTEDSVTGKNRPFTGLPGTGGKCKEKTAIIPTTVWDTGQRASCAQLSFSTCS